MCNNVCVFLDNFAYKISYILISYTPSETFFGLVLGWALATYSTFRKEKKEQKHWNEINLIYLKQQRKEINEFHERMIFTSTAEPHKQTYEEPFKYKTFLEKHESKMTAEAVYKTLEIRKMMSEIKGHKTVTKEKERMDELIRNIDELEEMLSQL